VAKDFSVIIGGRAGDGIDKSGLIIARILSELGYRIYIERDYPSIIRGGHTFSMIRACEEKIFCPKTKIDFLLALNQDCISFHKDKLVNPDSVIYDPDAVKSTGMPISATAIIKEENAPTVTRNSCMVAAFCKATGIEWGILEKVFKDNISREIELNLKVALKAYNEAKELLKIEKLAQKPLPLFTGSETIGMGLVKGKMDAYLAYPMTPSSPILHFLAEQAQNFGIKVIHPESEIAVIMMALGFSYAGKRAAVGTSGGGFCLMTEGLSFSAMAELPVIIIMGQRTGPSTGLPTYSGQTELNFVLNAGHGEFVRFIAGPGDLEEAHFWSQAAMNISWRYQIPSFIMTDKTLNEACASFDESMAGGIEEEAVLWDKTKPYKRYLDTENGISSFAFPGTKDAIVKINSYEHEESGITIEDTVTTKKMQDKRLRKKDIILKELEEKYEMVKTYGNADSPTALLTWGSNKGACIEIGKKLGLKVIIPSVLSPFPKNQFALAMKGNKKLVCVECNATGQLANLVSNCGFKVDEKILKYDGRPFFLEEIEKALTS